MNEEINNDTEPPPPQQKIMKGILDRYHQHENNEENMALASINENYNAAHEDSTDENNILTMPNNNDLINDENIDPQRSSSPTSSTITYGIFFGAVANLCSATLGAGVLSLPFALYQSGLIYGSILLLGSAWATCVSIDLLVCACDKYNLSTYEQVVDKCLGPKSRQIIEISILIFCIGVAVAYMITVGDIVQQVETMDIVHRRIAMIVIWSMAMLPLSCLRRMQSLQCASSIGISSIGILLLAATVHLIQQQENNNHHQNNIFYNNNNEDGSKLHVTLSSILSILESFALPANNGPLSVLRACPIVFFAFSCQVNVCQIYNELPGPTVNKMYKMKQITWVAVALCSLLYTSIALVTLLDFGKSLQPNVLSCYTLTRHNTLLHVAFLAMALAVVMAFPLNIFPARASLLQIFVTSKTQQEIHSTNNTNNENEHTLRQPLLSHNTEQQKQGLLQTEEFETPSQGTDILESPHREYYAPVSTVKDNLLMAEIPVHHDDNNDINQTHNNDNIGETSLLFFDDNNSTNNHNHEPHFSLCFHVLLSFLVAGLALVLALIVPNISIVFGLLGGTTSSLLGFVIPGLLGLHLDSSDSRAWILVIMGTVVGILTTSVTVYATVLELL